MSLLFFFFNDTATTEIYTLSLHDALPISGQRVLGLAARALDQVVDLVIGILAGAADVAQALDAGRAAADELRSEEHTSELQSQSNLVCRLLLEKKKNTYRKQN